jgi:hypothetical protein
MVVTRQEAKEFIHDFEKKANAAFQKHQEELHAKRKRKRKKFRLRLYHPAVRISFRFYSENKDGTFTYTQSEKGPTDMEWMQVGRVTVGRKANGKIDIIRCYTITRKSLHEQLTVPSYEDRVKVTKSEKRWRTRP